MEGWAENYYDALVHYAWSPERLDHLSDTERHKKIRKSPRDTLERLRFLEEPLNHIFAFFFALAPNRFVYDLFDAASLPHDNGSLEQIGRNLDQRFSVKNVTQPDFAFLGTEFFLTIECKVASASSLEQVVKYGYLAQKINEKCSRRHSLLFISPGPLASLFKAGQAEQESLKDAAVQHIGNINKTTFKKMTVDQRNELEHAIRALSIGHCTYQTFLDLLRRYRNDARTQPDGVAFRLYDGVIRELTHGRRDLKLEELV